VKSDQRFPPGTTSTRPSISGRLLPCPATVTHPPAGDRVKVFIGLPTKVGMEGFVEMAVVDFRAEPTA
jgi:hypothetical protein